jgi:N6-adenosine-specific RNA methylase IME4/ParB-like chromosome segregation protein Spo0J
MVSAMDANRRMADTGGEASRSGRRLTERRRSTGNARTPVGPSALASSARSAGKAEADSVATITVGGITYRLPFADLLPALADDDLNALRDDIGGRGIVVPIVIDEHYNVIDGANRLRIAAALGIRNVRADIRPGLSFAEKEELAEDINLHRRHLSREELRALIRRRLQRHPERSNRQIAKAVGADDHTVAAIRRDLETTAEIPQLPKTVGRDGRARTTTPARRAVHCFTATDVTRAAEVAQAAAAEPEKYGHLLEAMSRTGRAAGAHRNLMVARKAEAIAAAPPPLPRGPFRVIVADPPWAYDSRASDVSHRAANPYPQMALDAIRALPVASVAHDDAILWLWTPNSHLREAFTVLDAWGFRHKTVLTWAKDRIGTGDWLRGQTEHCLLAVRGRPVVTLSNQSTLITGPLREHSRKPDAFYALVESLCPAPMGGRLELFARQARPGWAAMGAEIDRFPAAKKAAR